MKILVSALFISLFLTLFSSFSNATELTKGLCEVRTNELGYDYKGPEHLSFHYDQSQLVITLGSQVETYPLGGRTGFKNASLPELSFTEHVFHSTQFNPETGVISGLKAIKKRYKYQNFIAGTSELEVTLVPKPENRYLVRFFFKVTSTPNPANKHKKNGVYILECAYKVD